MNELSLTKDVLTATFYVNWVLFCGPEALNFLLTATKCINQVYKQFPIKKLTAYFIVLNVLFHEVNVIFGFMAMFTIIFQLISGMMLPFSLIAESMIVLIFRDEKDIEDLYTDDFF